MGRLPDPSSSMATWSRWCRAGGKGKLSIHVTIRRRERAQNIAVSPALISSAISRPPISSARGRLTPANGAVASAISTRLATSSKRLKTAAPAPTATGVLSRVRASTTNAASPLGPGRTRLAPQLANVMASSVPVLERSMPSSNRYRQARATIKLKAPSAASTASPGEMSDNVSTRSAVRVARFRPHVILHLAAQGGVSRSVRDPAGDAMVNVVATVGLLRASVDAGCRRFIFASSGGAIYGRAPRLPTPERTTPAPLSPYGAAKLAAEGYLEMFGRTFGLSTLALRYSNVYGPYQDGTGEAGVVAITCDRLLSGRPPEIRGDGQQTRDFVFVGDVADAHVNALKSRAIGGINIGTGVATSVRTIVEELTRLAAF